MLYDWRESLQRLENIFKKPCLMLFPPHYLASSGGEGEKQNSVHSPTPPKGQTLTPALSLRRGSINLKLLASPRPRFVLKTQLTRNGAVPLAKASCVRRFCRRVRLPLLGERDGVRGDPQGKAVTPLIASFQDKQPLKS